jgi:LacI family transcriptional regulator
LIVKGIDDYQQFHSIHRKGFDGILIVSQTPEDDAFIDHLLQEEIPFVVVNRAIDKPGVSNVLSDDRNGARLITEHLVRCGHLKIALIEGKAGFQSTRERRAGFMDAQEAQRLHHEPRFTVEGDYTLESGYRAMERLLGLDDRPTAVFCMNDDMATGAMKAAVNAGLRVPEDISVAGFDDSHISAFVTPALSTVRRPIDKICSRAAQLLLERIDRKPAAAETVYLRTELVIRDSIQSIHSIRE